MIYWIMGIFVLIVVLIKASEKGNTEAEWKEKEKKQFLKKKMKR